VELKYDDEEVNKILKHQLVRERAKTRDKRKKAMLDSLERELQKPVPAE